MAVQEVVIVVKGDDKGLDSTLDKLEKVGAIDKKNAAQFAKTSKEFQDAITKRNQRIEELQKRLNRLGVEQGKAFDAKRIKRVNDLIRKTKDEVRTLGGEFEKTNKSLSRVDSTIKRIGKGILAAFAIQRVVSFTKESARMALELEGVKIAFDRLNNPGLLSELRSATKGTVSDLELMKRAVQAKNFQVPLERLGTFFEFARRRAKATGESVEFLTQSIILGIGRRSPLILDNLGISAVALREEFKRVGDTVTAMGNIVDQELGKMGEDLDTASEKVGKFEASWENFKTNFGTKIVPAIANSLDFITSKFLTTREVSDELFGQEAVQDVKDWAKGTGEAVEEVAKAFRLTTLKSLVSEVENFREDIKFLREGALEAGPEGSAARAKAVANAEAEIKELTKSTFANIKSKDAQVNALDSYIKSLNTSSDAEKISIDNLDNLRKELSFWKIELGKAEDGSKKFVIATKEISRISAEIARRTGKETEAQKKARTEREKAAAEAIKLEEERQKAFEKTVELILKGLDDEQQARVDLLGVIAKTEDDKVNAVEAARDLELQGLIGFEDQRAVVIAKTENDIANIREEFAKKKEDAEQEIRDNDLKKAEDQAAKLIEIFGRSEEFINIIREVGANKEEQRILDREAAIKKQLDFDLANTKLTEDQKLQIQQAADLELKQLKQERAESDKKQAKFNIILNTAVGVISALASVPPNVPLSIFIGGTGLAQLAVVESEPIPQFAEGVTDSPEGMAVVGEKGKELVYLNKGSTVVRNEMTNKYADVVDSLQNNTFDRDYMHREDIKALGLGKPTGSGWDDTDMLWALQRIEKNDKKWAHLISNNIVSAIDRQQRRFKM